jgi:hypothetical protein
MTPTGGPGRSAREEGGEGAEVGCGIDGPNWAMQVR